MTTVYPARIDNIISLPLVSDNTTQLSAVYFNVLRGAIVAVEATLGASPAGIYATVRARLDAIEQVLSNVTGGGGGQTIVFSGDVTGTNTHQTVQGLQGIHVDQVSPISGQALIYNGTTIGFSTNFGAQNLITTGGLTVGPIIAGSIATQLFDLSGKQIFNAITSSNVSDAGQAIIYYDQTTNKLLVSENGGAYVDLVGGGDSVKNVTGSYAVQPIDNIISVNTISSAPTITLESSPLINRRVLIKDANGLASTYNITVNGNGHLIDGNSTAIITQAYGSIDLIFNGTKWMSI